MKIDKTCSCGRHYDKMPEDARPSQFSDFPFDIVGWFFECECKSTLYVTNIVPEGGKYETENEKDVG